MQVKNTVQIKMTRYRILFLLMLNFQSVSAVEPEDFFDMDLEQLLNVKVETASKFSQKTIDAAAVIEVISQQDILNFGANSLLEVLDRATGISMSGTFFFPQNSVSMRGGLSTGADHHVLLMLNSRPLRDSFTGGENFPFYTAFPLKMIKQIEIIRGPGSVLYGSNAFSGVINIITLEAENIESEVTVKRGSFNTTSIQANSHYEKGSFKISAGLHWLTEEGWEFSARDNNGLAGKFDAGEDNLGVVVTGNAGELTFNTLFTRSQQDFWGPTSTWSIQNGEPTSILDIESTRYLLDLGYRFSFNEAHYLDLNASYNVQEFSHINYDSESQNSLVEMTHHWLEKSNLRWLNGGSIWHQKVDSFPGARNAPVTGFSQNWWSLYSQLEYQVSEELKWTLGAQFNKVPDVSGNLVPRVGVVYKSADNSGYKFNFGQAFRAAYGVETHFDLVICCRDDGTNLGGLRGNPTLEPEIITTADIQYFNYNDNSQLNVTIFASKQEDLIERERAADGVLDFLNRGELNVKGIELEYKYIFSTNSQLISSYTYQQNETGEGIENFTLSPNTMLKLGVTHDFDNKTRLALFNSYVDDQHDNIIRHSARKLVNPPAKNYNLLTANLRIPLDNIRLFSRSNTYLEFYGYNLLDENIYQPEVAGGQINTSPLRAGRSWYVSLTMSL